MKLKTCPMAGQEKTITHKLGHILCMMLKTCPMAGLEKFSSLFRTGKFVEICTTSEVLKTSEV
ncbi:MAG: hypothetical protein Q7J16_03305 [Candidatus Cloacimonadales bacterium]|nr:hypothetical protein [Candidatus Cloacimonadales bacterium]